MAGTFSAVTELNWLQWQKKPSLSSRAIPNHANFANLLGSSARLNETVSPIVSESRHVAGGVLPASCNGPRGREPV